MGYNDGNVFVVGTSVVGVTMLVTDDCLCTDDIVPVVKFCKKTIEGRGEGKLQASWAFLICSFSCNAC